MWCKLPSFLRNIPEPFSNNEKFLDSNLTFLLPSSSSSSSFTLLIPQKFPANGRCNNGSRVSRKILSRRGLRNQRGTSRQRINVSPPPPLFLSFSRGKREEARKRGWIFVVACIWYIMPEKARDSRAKFSVETDGEEGEAELPARFPRFRRVFAHEIGQKRVLCCLSASVVDFSKSRIFWKKKGKGGEELDWIGWDSMQYAFICALYFAY